MGTSIEGASTALTAKSEAVPLRVQVENNRKIMIRLMNACAAISIAFVLLLSFWLRPDPRGFGTHEQLLLHPCAFHEMTGLPCPSCGMTTAFAHMARWQIRDAFFAQPMGTLGFLGCILLLPLTVVATIYGLDLLRIGRRLPWKWIGWTFGLMFLLAWIFKLSVSLNR
jgi:hypothetical protein